MYRLLCLFLLVSIASLFAHTKLLGGVEIILQIDTESKAIVRGAEIDPPSMELYSLRIEDSWVEVKEGATNIIMDREGDQLISFRSAKREYESTSLFALFDLRADAYGRVLGTDNLGYRAGTYGTATPQILVDHIFSIADPDSVQAPEFEDVGNERQWMSGDVRLARWSLDGSELSETRLDNFVFWLRQTSGGYPVILENLLAGGVLPDEFEILLNDGRSTKKISIELVGLREKPDMTLESRMEGFSLNSIGSETDTLVALLDWVRGGTEFGKSLISNGGAKAVAADEAFENGDPIRGILQLIRTQMISGVSPDLELESYAAQIKASRTAANLLISLNASSIEQAEQAVQTFSVLSDAFEDQAAVLKILTADNLNRLGRLDLAEGLYREAILSDPSLAVAYKGIGDIYRAKNRYPMAWMCYDAFGIVGPNQPIMKMIDEMKQNLIRQFPGFF